MDLCKRMLWLLLTGMFLAVVACGGSTDRPTFQPLPTPTTPPNLVAFTDESNSFAIKYPPDWTLELSQMNAIESFMKDVISGNTDDMSVENIGVVFLSIDPTEEFVLGIAVESLPLSNMTVDEYNEAADKFARELTPSTKINRTAHVVVDGRPSIISDSEFELSDLFEGENEKQRDIQLVTIQGKTAWIVTCSIPKEALEIVETCDALVRTFRILQ